MTGSPPIQFLDAAAGYLSFRGAVLFCSANRVASLTRRGDTVAVTNEVFIVDNDPSVGAALSVVLSGEGYQVVEFRRRRSLPRRGALAHAGMRSARMCTCRAASGLESSSSSTRRAIRRPILVISGRGDIPTAVEAIRNGALDFIEKPFDTVAVAARVRSAIDAWHNGQRQGQHSGARFFRARPAHRARTRRAGADRARRLEQGGRARARHLTAHHRSASRAHHGEARRQERRRPGAHRAARRPRALNFTSR